MKIMKFTWQMGRFSVYQQMDNRSTSLFESDVYFSSTVARYGLQDGSFGVLPVNSSEGPGPARSLLSSQEPGRAMPLHFARKSVVMIVKQGELSKADRLDTGDSSTKLLMISTMRLPSSFRCLLSLPIELQRLSHFAQGLCKHGQL